MSEQRKAVIKNADMSEDMQQDAVDIASQALAKYNIEKVSPRESGSVNHFWSQQSEDPGHRGSKEIDLGWHFGSSEAGG